MPILRLPECLIPIVVCATVIGRCLTTAVADERDAFRKVKSILEHRCLSCHNEVDRKGDFSLQLSSSLNGSGFLVAGNSAESHLLTVVQPDGDLPPSMPKDGPILSRDEIRSIADWIDEGAHWRAELELQEPVVSDFDWWSFRPLVRPDVPVDAADITTADWSRTEIDAFVLRKHRQLQLTHAPEADRHTLIRRLTYDLTGLPPTLPEIRSFEADAAPDAYEALVDRLLASPRYGERWARHWLDIVKYADTCGYDKDKLRPNAWPYRDYVVRSFNDDKPYARFIQEQIAGDVLFAGEPDGILGLGFIAAGPWDFIGHVEVPETKIDGRVARNLDRDEMVSNTMNTFCSVTIQCARCHNHKFDPFTQEHYYSLQSVFAAVDRAERPYDVDPSVERKRRELTALEKSLTAELNSLDEAVKQAGGQPLMVLEGRISELKPKAEPADKQPAFGYHSQIAAQPDMEKWVEVDLGREVQIDRIMLHPCHDDFAAIGSGFGFPKRFRIEVLSTPKAGSGPEESDNTASESQKNQPKQSSVVVADYSASDFPNPGLHPVEVMCGNVTGQVIRVTATKLVERKNDYILALAELEVIDGSGVNVALTATVRALDSIEAPVRWSKSNLNDGIWANAADPGAVAELAAAETQRAKILNRILTPERVAKRQRLQQQRKTTEHQIQALPVGRMVYAAATHFSPQGNFKPTSGAPRTISVLHRGNIQQPKQTVLPGVVPLAQNSRWKFDLPEGHNEADRRAMLARWISSPDNPLTWRSIANRIWQYHFGAGIVDSPNDMGRMGQLPSHPELLDWLADEFRRTQSFKHMHRLICLSATYRQVSTHDAKNFLIDSENQFLWRMNRRRLSAEELRDSILQVSGRLNLKMGGPGFYLFALEKTDHSPHYEYHKFDPNDEASHRRSVYRFIARSQPDPFMTTLDCADSSQSTPRRTETQTALQALSLLNNKFNLAMAQHFANRMLSEAGDADASFRAFECVTGRSPTPEEHEQLDRYTREYGLPNLCRILFNTSEFVFVD